MDITQELFFPQIHYFDPDFVSMYEQTWARLETCWIPFKSDNKNKPSGYIDTGDDELHIIDVITSSFFLLYSNNDTLNPTHALDFFYRKQDEDGSIHSVYSKSTGEPISQRGNPDAIAPPFLLWAEYNYYNRTDNKRRLKEILPKIDNYLNWLAEKYKDNTGMFIVPQAATYTNNLPRQDAVYFLDFNAQMALAYHFMIKLATAGNFRNHVFKYTKAYYKLKAIINDNFWDSEDKFYYDLDEKKRFVKIKSINCFWTLLAQIPNNAQALALRDVLNDPEHFFSQNSFPTLAKSSPFFSPAGMGHKGSVFPFYTYMVIKGLTTYGFHEFARESAIRHIFSILANFYAAGDSSLGEFWEAYQPDDFQPARPSGKNHLIRKNFFPSIGVATISLIIENIIGFDICLPKKMVYWTIPHLEFMGIEGLQLKRNLISTILQQTIRGWEIRHSSEKLYYFSVDIIEKEIKKTLPIPSGKCSLLVDKL